MKPGDIHKAIAILRTEVRQWAVPGIAHYARSPFTVLISCLLSLRTKDATMIAASDRLFAVAFDPQTMLAIPAEDIEKLIYPVAFFRVKAKTIHEICHHLIDRFAGKVPALLEDLLSLPGVGRKTANIVVTIAFAKKGIAVDTHVHRIFNRLGYVRTRTADETELALRRKLPERYWMVTNDLLVAYGQNLCKPVSPFCSRCRIAEYCRQIEVKTSR